jgi:hypothetical protein
MSMKFTPGPWSIHPVASTAVVGSTGFVVAACGGHSSNARDPEELHSELQANARLIAAAPDLLEAARAAMLVLAGEHDTDSARQHAESLARAAIAKAAGSAS